ncbi:hypothetical protein F4810DRAFT_104760 [Camillea tinctor]|nr:hypothetical protein F4810DRAFT_104760 [Camillea tinctor]
MGRRGKERRTSIRHRTQREHHRRDIIHDIRRQTVIVHRRAPHKRNHNIPLREIPVREEQLERRHGEYNRSLAPHGASAPARAQTPRAPRSSPSRAHLPRQLPHEGEHGRGVRGVQRGREVHLHVAEAGAVPPARPVVGGPQQRVGDGEQVEQGHDAGEGRGGQGPVAQEQPEGDPAEERADEREEHAGDQVGEQGAEDARKPRMSLEPIVERVFTRGQVCK